MSTPQEDKVILEMTADESVHFIQAVTARIKELTAQTKTAEAFREVFVLHGLVTRIDPQVRKIAEKEMLLEALKQEREAKR
jgi:hypothetical protein